MSAEFWAGFGLGVAVQTFNFLWNERRRRRAQTLEVDAWLSRLRGRP